MHPTKIDTGKFILHKLEELIEKKVPSNKKARALFRLFTLFWEEISFTEKLNFTTLFVRMAYVSSSYSIDGNTMFLCHRFRRIIESNQLNDKNSNAIFELGSVALRNVLQETLSLTSELPELINLYVDPKLVEKQYTPVKFQSSLRAVITEIDVEKYSITFILEEEGTEYHTAVFDIEQKNELFNSNLLSIKKLYNLPIVATLIDVEIDDKGRYIPSALVVWPDFLIDVTSISSIFHQNSTSPIKYLLSKFLPTTPNESLLIGNIANTFLDHLLYEPETPFIELRKKIFGINPLQLAQYNDGEVKGLIRKSKEHYDNIRECIMSEFKDQNIETKNSYVEPSFLSNSIGFQGRLDLLHVNPKSGDVDIVELKSGSAFRPNANNISESHYRQLMIYEMMIKSLNKKKTKPKNYILYSKYSENRLRYAGHSRAHQYEIIKYRNLAVFMEQLLLNADHPNHDIFEKFNPKKIHDQHRFEKRDAEKIYVAYKSCDKLEQDYIKKFTSFITREYHLAKIGEHGIDKSNGMAGLWLDPLDEKIDEFRVLSKLIIHTNQTNQDIPILQLGYSDYSNKLSRFRVGDIIIIYPDIIKGYGAVNSQLFKATILEVSETKISIRLRASQMNNQVFDEYKYWNIESDFLDRSITKMYQSLYRFMLLKTDKKELILGRRPPEKYIIKEHSASSPDLSPEQNQIINEIISCEEYYLLWGPPGTGKTSVIVKNLIKYYYEHTDENILLLAYTNRAVDEMCAALESIDTSLKSEYIRLGSRYSVGQEYKSNVFSEKLEHIETRAELNGLLSKTRIFLSTVSSMHSNWELFKVKKFSTVIVDEASQLLEPYVIDMLGQFSKFVLIGDHKQLPAVVKQEDRYTKIEHEGLKAIELNNLKNSLFERLFRIATKNGWHWAMGTLTDQGRMHEDIMHFVSNKYYNNQLGILKKISRLSEVSTLKNHPLFSSRMVFIDTPKDDSLTIKVNEVEAKLVVLIYKKLKEEILKTQEKLSHMDIGVITPFRAQIAKITKEFTDADIDTNDFTIDTVERYQGGARNHIIISLCTNDRSVLSMISNKSDEGLDRKLNVAITRAKEHLFILGNKAILSKEKSYSELIEHCFQLDYRTLLS